MTDMKPYKLLFLCTGNSARSIFAEYLMRELARGRFETYSAGSDPSGVVNPLTVAVLKSHFNIDAGGARSKSWEEFKDEELHFDFVITVCDHARETCPVWPGQPVNAHWGSDDPVAFEGTEEEKERFFYQVAMQIKYRIELFLSLPMESLDRARLEEMTREIGTKG